MIEVKPPYESASYVGLTMDALNRSKIQVEQEGLSYQIKGQQVYQPIDCTVEGDDSQMAFFAMEALIHHVPLDVLNIRHDSRQGDHVIVDLVKRMGGQAKEIENGYRFDGTSLHACVIDLADCPDLGPKLYLHWHPNVRVRLPSLTPAVCASKKATVLHAWKRR